ncbi:MAG: hypothetical protein WC208_08040 [Gallionella sp.]|jgi:hypothetical protein
MQTFLVSLIAFAVLTACGGIDRKPPSAGVYLYKYLGSVQCTGGGTSLQTMKLQLADAGIPALTSSCGTDGKVYVAVCGAADGRIGIFEVPAAQAQAASTLGFAPVSRLPAATKLACH